MTRALVVGASGISGYNAAAHLVEAGWEVFGVCRRPGQTPAGVTEVLVDVQESDSLASAIGGLRSTHLVYGTWARQATEAENCAVNGRMLRNVLDAAGPAQSLQHVALVTGLKHYLGPFEAYAQKPMETPFREDMPRLPYQNFYYDQEDILFEAAARYGFTWSVHRAHTMIGWALGNAMNMGVTLAVYGSICREAGRPFVFPGSPQQYNGVTDVTDAALLAEQLHFSATAPEAANEALNTVNGDVFRWRTMWGTLAAHIGAEVGPYPGTGRSLETEMAGAEAEWQAIVERHGLRPSRLEELASWWHTDADLGREMETFADMTKSRTLGFTGFRDTRGTFTSLIDRLRAEMVIP